MGIYTGAGGIARQVSKLYIGVDGTARQVQKMYVGVDGKARLVYACGSPISGRSVGSIVKIRVNGAYRDFIIVHQGLPSGDYDASCNGVWLLQRYVYDNVSYNSDFYENSNIHSYMNNTFFSQLDAGVQGIVKWVKIPFRDNTGAKGLDTRAFALSAAESGDKNTIGDTCGTTLAYFAAGNSASATYENGSAQTWWTRTRYKGMFSSGMYYIMENGGNNHSSGGTYAVRPCIIVPYNTLVDENGYIVA